MDRIDVAFRGEGSGVAELTWGQQSMLLTMDRERSWLPMGGHQPVAPGATLADVVDELRYSQERYQSFRTRLLHDGRPMQQVHAAGTVTVEVYETSDDPVAFAAEVEHAYRTAQPDLTADWPLRAAVICRDGRPERLVAIMPHLVTDATGAGVMVAEATARVATPVTGPQPLELTAWQRSPAGERCSTAAVRHWERHLPSVTVLSPTLRPDPQQFPKARFTSPAMASAAPAVAARTGVDPATILSTAFMMAVGQVTGTVQVAVRHLVGNRFRAGLAEVVSPLAQLGLCVADVAVPLDEALGRVARASLAAHKHAYYNPLQLADLLARTDTDTTRTVCYNDRRTSRAAAPDTPAGDGLFEWVGASTGPTEPLFLHIDDEPGALVLTIDVDTAFLSRTDAEAIARTMESIIVKGRTA
ncbi:condensation domain-containing protein [Dactylosporangium sp. NBC_01737]|uniref:condensation domain-containing protein n=1 Tax=Dactylosporangium sp. NBC_01737 TaxID=2975959 RepID=UPI002E13FD9F|nr:condensation domain-containing protein [Dactylosporangium sp. NBC_01737]